LATDADRYAVIGNPIAHSKSPAIHAAFARQTGQHLVYERLLAPPDAFNETVAQFVRDGGKGLNVTAPFKLQAFALASEHSDRAEQAGACNTLAWRDTHWFGDNTDGVGLVRELTVNLRIELGGRDILILGAGGAARGIIAPLLAAAPQHMVVTNRNPVRAEELARVFATSAVLRAEAPEDLDGEHFDIVLNATSADASTMHHHVTELKLPWPTTIFAPAALAYDLTYADEATPFMRWAKAHGAVRISDGLGMLIEQAAESFLILRGVRPDTAPVLSLLRENRNQHAPNPGDMAGPARSER